MKKFLAAILTLAAAICLIFGISACSETICKLNFIVDDNVYATIETNGEETVSMPKDPAKEGYRFDGWYWDKDVWQRPFTADSLLHEKLTSNKSVYAKWEKEGPAKSGTVTFNAMGGSAVEKATVTYDSEFTFPVPAREGYAFNGWKTSDGALLTDGKGKGKDVWKLTGDVTLTADWTAIEYTITYQETKGAQNPNRTIYTIEDETFPLQALSAAGSRFTGWYDGETLVTEIVRGSFGNKTLTATWEPDTLELEEIQLDESKLAVKETDSPSAALFSASCKDVKGNPVEVAVSYTGEWKAGKTVTVVFTAQAEGAVPQTKTLSGVKVYGMPEITVGNTAVKDSEAVTASALQATAQDSFGEDLDITVTLASGKFESGQTATYTLTATDKAGNVCTKEGVEVKVYGMPTITVAESKKDFVNFDDEIDASLFGITGKDAFGGDVQVEVTIEGELVAGETITIVIHIVDELGNEITQRIEGVKVYGEPKITYNESKHEIREGDKLTADLFSAGAQDSFGEVVTVTVELLDGTQAAGNTITVRLTATDGKGNAKTVDIQIKVYGTPSLPEPSKKAFKVEDSITAEALGLSAQDSFGQPLEIKLTHTGEQTAGMVMTFTASVTDPAGNTQTKEIEVKIYGMPTISEPSKTDFKVEDSITAETLGLSAQDSFGEPLDVTLSHTGTQQAGETMTFTATVTDPAGNTQTKEIEVRIYGTPTITEPSKTDFKVEDSITAEALGLSAQDSFGQPLEIDLTHTGTQQAGETMTFTASVTDPVGNTQTKEIEVKIYGMFEITVGKTAVKDSETVTASSLQATAQDSFGEDLDIIVTLASGMFESGQTATYTLTATDKAGNTCTKEGVEAKVYGMPTLTSPEFVCKTTDLTSGSAEFKVVDSFGEELPFEIEVEGTVQCDEHITVTLTATDEAGNPFSRSLEYTVQHRWSEGVCLDCRTEHTEHVLTPDSEKTDEGHTGTCSVCGKTVTEDHTYENGVCTECGYAHQNHTYGDDNTCSVCGKELYNKSEDGTMIYFGEYPQTEVTDQNDSDKSLRNSLNIAAGTLPTSTDAEKWTDYNYYIEGSVQSYMWYIDVEYQGSRYRGVYFTSYRPYDTAGSSSTGNSNQDYNGYRTNTVYWFKYEPIEWRILEQKNGTALLMANIILDSQHYYRNFGLRTIDGKTVHPNNYKESDIRAWLTTTFYETAFDELAKQIIETTTVDNSAASTASSSNPNACENTQDKVFLLSYQEILNTSYGFSSSNSSNTTRQLKSTDYAKSQGVYVNPDSRYRGNGCWWLRSPGSYSIAYAYYVDFDGHANEKNFNYTSGGVVPALRIRL